MIQNIKTCIKREVYLELNCCPLFVYRLKIINIKAKELSYCQQEIHFLSYYAILSRVTLKDRHQTDETKRTPTKPKSKLFNFEKKKKISRTKIEHKILEEGKINDYK